MNLSDRGSSVQGVDQLISARTAENMVNLHHICVSCGRQFIDCYEHQGYSAEVKKECLEMYVNGLGFRAIERVKKVQTLADSLTLRYHTTAGLTQLAQCDRNLVVHIYY